MATEKRPIVAGDEVKIGQVMTATLSLQDARYKTADAVNRLFDRTLARMHEVPGVERAAVCLTLPYERALNVGGRWVGAKYAAIEQDDCYGQSPLEAIRVSFENLTRSGIA